MKTAIARLQRGDKVRFLGVRMFWFTNMIEDAKAKLKIGKVYTISDVQEASSWTGIRLYETGDSQYNSGWFEIV